MLEHEPLFYSPFLLGSMSLVSRERKENMPRSKSKPPGGGEYIRGMAPANGIEAFRMIPEQARGSVFHEIDLAHSQRRIDAFVGRRGAHEPGVIDRLETSVIKMTGERSMRRGAIS